MTRSSTASPVRALGVALLLAATAAPAAAQTTPAPSDRPADAAGPYTVAFRGAPLREALAEIVRLTGINLAYTDGLVEGARASCVRRRASAEALLSCALDGTGLDYVRSSSGTYVLVRAVREVPPPGRIAGRVVDDETGQPLPSATVLLADARTATAAGADGLFALSDVVPGRHRIVATYVGYEPAVLGEVLVAPGAASAVELRLRPRPAPLAPVVVDGLTERLPSAALGRGERGGAVDRADAARADTERAGETLAPGSTAAPGAAGTPDVTRGAALVLGVSAALPLADLHVQGGSTAEHVTRLDGVPVRDPVALGRYLGAFSPLAVGRLTVHKAGFGVEHGSALAGAVDLEHDLGAARPGVVVQADPLAVNARVSAPLAGPGGTGAVMAAVRRSVWGLYDAPAVASLLDRWNRLDPVLTAAWLRVPVAAASLRPLGHTPDVSFSDVHAAVRFRPEPFGTLTASLYRARNHIGADLAAVQQRPVADRVLAVRDVYDWTNSAGQARYVRLVGARGLVGAHVRGSRHVSSYSYRFAQAPVDAASDAAADTAAALFARVDRSRGADAAHVLTEWAAEADGTLSVGPGREVEVRLGAERVAARFGAGNSFVAPFAVDETAWLGTGHLRGRAAFGLRVTVEGGTRLTYVPTRQTLYAEPRVAVRYDGTAGGTAVAVRVAGGLHRQFVNGFAFRSAGPAAVVPELLFWLPVSAGVAPATALHAAADALVLPGRGWTVRAEVFGRHEPRTLALDVPALLAAPASAVPRDVRPDEVVAEARGSAVGGGLRVEQAGRAVRWTASYSAERVRRTVPGRYGGRAVTAPWETPHRLSGEAHARLGGGFGASASGAAAWGRSWGFRHAYYDYAPEALGAGEPGDARLPALVSLDASVSYERSVGPSRLRVELGVTNALGRTNVYDWSAGASGSGESGLLPRGLPGRTGFAVVRVSR